MSRRLLPSCSAILLFGLPFCLHAQESRWTGAVDSDWNEAGNWIGGVPSGNAAVARFGMNPVRANVEQTSGNPAFHRIIFDPYAAAHTLSGNGSLSLQGTGRGVTLGFGSSSQTFDVALNMDGTGILRNDSLSGTLIFNKALNNLDRALYLRGLGEGVFTGNTQTRLDSVRGGGTWTFAGENLSGPTGNNTWSGGTRVILDYRNNANAKLTLPTNFYLRGASVEVIGAATGTTVVSLTADKILPGAATFTDGYGFASRFQGTPTGTGEVVFDFANHFRDATALQGYVHFTGDATFRATALRDGGNVTHPVWVIGDQYATFDSENEVLAARSLATIDAGSGSFVGGTNYFGTTLAAGTTTRTSGVTAKGVRLVSADEATWQVNGQFLTSSSVGTSLLFAGEHDVTIQANGFGGGQTHWINLGVEDAVLTLDGPLSTSASTDHRKSGAGTLVLLNSENKTVAASVQALHVGEGTLRLGYSEVMGSAPSNNGIYVQSGATVALQGDLSLKAGTTTYLHGLGHEKGGALRNHEGDNRLAGTVMFGTTASIVSDEGELELAGTLDALENEPVTVIFGGAGTTRVSGDVTANVNGGFYKEGSGTVILEGTSLSTGPTEIHEGAFLLDGGMLSGEVAVRNGAVFGGSGTLGGSTLLDDGSRLRLELHGSLDDYLVTTQSFTLGEEVELQITLHQSAQIDDIFHLVSNSATITGTFARVNGAEFLPGDTFTLDYDGYLYTLGLSYGAGIDATVLNVEAIPEPGVWSLLGVAGLCGWWWQKRRSAVKTI